LEVCAAISNCLKTEVTQENIVLIVVNMSCTGLIDETVNITYVIHDNLIYGLTTGQTSPTSKQGFVTKTSPRGEWSIAINPLAQALTTHASFVARGFAGAPKQLKDILVQAVQHEGFALVDVLQPCVSFNKVNTYQFYKERVYKLEDTDHDTGDWDQAYKRA